MISLGKRNERLKKIHEELGIQSALPALIPEQAPSQSSGRKRKHMELEPEIKVYGFECNRRLLKGVHFVNNMVIKEPEYVIFFTDVFGDDGVAAGWHGGGEEVGDDEVVMLVLLWRVGDDIGVGGQLLGWPEVAGGGRRWPVAAPNFRERGGGIWGLGTVRVHDMWDGDDSITAGDGMGDIHLLRDGSDGGDDNGNGDGDGDGDAATN
ncbi:hypothetical protein Tco_0475253 [Tanacetum coccineum]